MEHGFGVIAAKFYAWLLAIFPAAIGSALSIYMHREKTSGMGNMERFTVFLFGISLAHYIGGAAIEYWNIQQNSYISDAIKLTIGFMGMAALAQFMVQLPEFVRAMRKRVIGED